MISLWHITQHELLYLQVPNSARLLDEFFKFDIFDPEISTIEISTSPIIISDYDPLEISEPTNRVTIHQKIAIFVVKITISNWKNFYKEKFFG